MQKIAPILFFLLFFALTGHSQLTSYASIPYSTGFETGLDANWASVTTTTGRVRIHQSGTLVWSTQTALSHSGNYFLGLDDSTGGSFVSQQAWMGLNLAGASNVVLDFWWSDWNDESHTFDAMFMSDNGGSTFTQVYNFNPASFTDLVWHHFTFNMDSIAAIHNLNYTSNFVVMFQQHDNYYFAGGNDGFLFDDITVSGNACSGDTTAPTALCQNFTVQLAPAGSATIQPADIDNGSSDDCVISNMSLNQSTFTCADLGSNPVTLTVEDAVGQQSTCSAMVMVQDTAGLTTIPVNLGPDQNVCEDASIPLDAGGSPTSYLWNTGDSVRTIFVGPGSYSVIVSNANGCSGTDSIVLSQIMVPDPNIRVVGSGQPVLCPMDTLVLEADSLFASYSWSSGGNSYFTSVTTAGEVILTVTDGNGCSRMDTVSVTLSTLPLPNPTIDPSPVAYACDGSNAILDAGAGYSSYSWSNGDTSQVAMVGQGTYSVTVTNSDGCEGSTSTEVRDTTSTPTSITQTGDTLCASGSGSFSWLINGTATGDTTDCIIGTQNGVYSVVLVNEVGCESTDSLTFMVGLDPAYNLVESFSVSPNPFKETTQFAFRLAEAGNVRLEILALDGKKLPTLFEGRVSPGETVEVDFEGAGLSSGLYFYRLHTPQGVARSGKVVLMR